MILAVAIPRATAQVVAPGQNPADIGRPPRPAEWDREGEEPDARRYVAALAGLKPRRLAPGASGVVTLVLALQTKGVLLAGSEFQVTYSREQQPVRLGAWTREQPKPSERYPRFADVPVFDDTVEVEIPVQVDQGARHGSFPIRINVTFPVHDGASGSELGTYRNSVVCSVEVGAPLPRPTVRRPAESGGDRSSGGDPAVGGSEAGAPDPTTPGAPAPTGGDPIEPGVLGGAAPADAASGAVEPSRGPSPEPGRGATWVWAALGALVLGLAAVFLKRRA